MALKSSEAETAQIGDAIGAAWIATAKVHSVAQFMQEEEPRLLQQRENDKARQFRDDMIILTAVVFGSVVLLFAIYRDARKQKLAQIEVQRQVADLLMNMPATACSCEWDPGAMLSSCMFRPIPRRFEDYRQRPCRKVQHLRLSPCMKMTVNK